jgi:hypothetical protein
MDIEKLGPHVKCSKRRTCRMNCMSACNTMQLTDPREEAAAEKWKREYGPNGWRANERH